MNEFSPLFKLFSVLIVISPIFYAPSYKTHLEVYGGDYQRHFIKANNLVGIFKPEWKNESKRMVNYSSLFHKTLLFFSNLNLNNFLFVFNSLMVLFFFLFRACFFYLTNYLKKHIQAIILFVLFVIPDFLPKYISLIFGDLTNFTWGFYSFELLISHSGMLPSFMTFVLMMVGSIYSTFLFPISFVCFFLGFSSRIIIFTFLLMNIIFSKKLRPLVTTFFFFLMIIESKVELFYRLLLLLDARAYLTILWFCSFWLLKLNRERRKK